MSKKLTTKQEKILQVLQNSKQALSVAEIHERVSQDVDLATVYRAVDKMSDDGIIKKLLLDGKKALYEYCHDSHHHAVCGNCDNLIHFHIDEEKLRHIISIPNFDIDDIEIIVRGKHCNL